jgi:Leucine-rich repeat (LRR) protein
MVGKLRGLKSLHLRGTNITDEDLRLIGTMTHLKSLSIQYQNISDEALRHLEGMKNLTTLNLAYCRFIRDEGIARLQKALPKCQILH